MRKNHLEFNFLLTAISFTEFQSTFFSLFSRKFYEAYIIFWLDGRRSINFYIVVMLFYHELGGVGEIVTEESVYLNSIYSN
jgi:hypothetical protein